MAKRWHVGIILAAAGLCLLFEELLAGFSQTEAGSHPDVTTALQQQQQQPASTALQQQQRQQQPPASTAQQQRQQQPDPGTSAQEPVSFPGAAHGQDFWCQTSMRYPLGDTIGTTFRIRNARVSASHAPEESAHIHIHNEHAVQSEFRDCSRRMNWADYNRNGRLPVLVGEADGDNDRCQNHSGTAVFAVEWGTTSVYHILIDTIFPLFYTLSVLNISILPTQIVIMDNDRWIRPEPFYSSAFRTVFGAAPVRANAISGCFENVVVGFFQHMRLFVPSDAPAVQYVPELQGSIQSLRDHVLNRTRTSSTGPVDKVLLLQRPVANGRYLLNEDLLERECKGAGVYTCQVVDLSTMSFEDQIQSVRNAAVLAGAEGAAMALTLFGPDHQVVVQIRHPHFLHKFQTALMQYLVNRTNFEWMGTVARGAIMVNPLMFRFLLQEWASLRDARGAYLSPMGLRDIDVLGPDCEAAFVAHIAKRAVSRNGQLIFTTGSNYLPWWRHLVAHLKISHRLHQTLFVVMTESECEEMWEAGILCFQDRSEWTRSILATGQDLGHYGIPVIVKWLYAKRLVELGYRTMFTDADVALLRDPFLVFDDRYDVMGLSDLLETREPCLNHRHGTCQSTGIMVFQPTAAALQFLHNMTARIQAAPAVWEQEMFNIVMPLSLDSCRYRLLDDHLAANCRQFRAYALRDGLGQAKKDLVMLHLGFVQSRDKGAVFGQYGVLLKDRAFGAERIRVTQGIDLLLPGQSDHPDALCRPVGIWAFPAPPEASSVPNSTHE